MSVKKTNRTSDAVGRDGDRSFTYGIIAFAIIEALVLIPFVLYMIFRSGALPR
ncbi:MAG TPA: hypothetical protein VM934_16600 [Pyrinomonadaceae bacterium]|jgi:F0F1-type ATP synthase membrane subunit c/vacuolar-type H+-ATPase subunit K|nr:hypothetical protein [Pyrinomonadaceae bacterium]